MNLAGYLEFVNDIMLREQQQKWFFELENKVRQGTDLYKSLDKFGKQQLWSELRNRVRTEEIKAWYSEPEGESLFQGTSISSLTIGYEIEEPLRFNSIYDLEEEIANSYIKLHDKYANIAKNAILENVDSWIRQGLYYGVVICSKIISQALGLCVYHKDIIFDIMGHRVDPHEITSYPQDVREAYFEKCLCKIKCFGELNLERRELEASLVLADISKPKIKEYEDKILLAPVRCNEIAAILSERVTNLIRTKTSCRINPPSLAVTIYDTDTPYTYHQIMGYDYQNTAPILPGLTVLGCSGTIDAFRWLYSYRVSLISQKMQKGSLYSEVQRRFMPFVFFGVLVPRDAEILLDMKNLHRLRYRGNLSPDLEFAYLIPNIFQSEQNEVLDFDWEQFREKHLMRK